MLKVLITAMASFWLMLVPAVVSGNTVQAQQTAAAVLSESKPGGMYAETVKSEAVTQAAE